MNPADLDGLLKRESAHVEWKRQAAEVEDVVRNLSAFANDIEGSGQGGWVICGVEEADDGHGFPAARLAGLASSRFKEVQGKVLAWCRERVTPPIIPRVDELPVPDDPARRILIFHVSTSPHLHTFRESNGSTLCWVRHDSQTVEARGSSCGSSGKTSPTPHLSYSGPVRERLSTTSTSSPRESSWAKHIYPTRPRST